MLERTSVHCLGQGPPDKLKQQSRNLHLVIRDMEEFAGKILARVVAGRDFSGPRAPWCFPEVSRAFMSFPEAEHPTRWPSALTYNSSPYVGLLSVSQHPLLLTRSYILSPQISPAFNSETSGSFCQWDKANMRQPNSVPVPSGAASCFCSRYILFGLGFSLSHMG